MTKLSKTAMLTASLVLVGASVAGCSDGGGSGAPTDASEGDFCTGLTSLFSDGGPMASESQEEALAAIKSWATELEKVGTPENIPEEAREGFELMIEEVADLDKDDTAADFQNLDEDLSEAEKKATAAFEKYSADACGAMELETPELPEVPTPTS